MSKGGESVDINLQDDNKTVILDLIRSSRIPHTVIFEGGSEDERKNAALLLAAGAVCESDDRPCLSCPACLKAIENRHPDVFIPEPSKNLKSGILSLKDLRDDYLSQMSIKPNEAPCKVYIFNEADTLLREDSQNALLKSLEDAPDYVVIMLLASNITMMLETVRSRCITWELKPVPEPELKKYLMTELQVPDYRADIAIAFAQGNIFALCTWQQNVMNYVNML